jgi:predicted DNA-binding transcriptional regulator YafY
MSGGRHALIVRQWKLLLVLAATTQGRTLPSLTAEVGEGLHERTIRRDLEALSQVFTVTRQEVDGKVRYRIHPDVLLGELTRAGVV